jgi:effector-binding domain-containing protein
MLRKIAIVVAAVLLIFVAVGFLLPAVAHVERRITIEAKPAAVFALVNDFHQINQWSPWLDTDPNALYTISGPRRGVGATITWDGQIVGQGSQTITASEPYVRVTSALELDGSGGAIGTFELLQTETGTHVIWSFDNDFGLNPVGRYFGLILDGIVGPNYEKGLQDLKTMAENLPSADFSDVEVEHQTMEAMDIVFLTAASAPEAAAISAALGDAYFELLNFMDKYHLREAGAPISISGSFDGSLLRFDAAIPVRGLDDNTARNTSGVQLGRTYAGPVIRVKHVGAYRSLGRTHDKIAAYLAALGIRRNGDPWESYVSDPTRVPADELLTYVYYPIVAE